MSDKTNKPAAKPVKAGEFEFDTGLDIPATTRNSAPSKMAERLHAMPVGASFLEPVEVPATIKDAGERAKVFKETARTTSNRLSGVIRRFKKKNPGYDFVIRTVDDEALGRGVRVWRVEPAK